MEEKQQFGKEFDNRYQIGAKIGEGNFASVHLCVDKLELTEWAVKIMKKDSMSDEDIAAFYVEIDILKKLDLKGKDLEEYSLETVQMFFDDAQQAGYRL